MNLVADSMQYLLGINAEVYYSESPNYRYEKPIFGIHAQLDLFNLVEDVGAGVSVFQQIYTLDNRFNSFRTYNLYIHNFSNYSSRDSYFVYGFYGGVKRSEIEFENYKTSNIKKLTIHLPLIGFRFTSEQWGLDISWTQAENRKPVLAYELKFSNGNGIILRIGRINRGVITSIDSELYLLIGYEFFK